MPQAEIVSLYRNALQHGIPIDQVEEKTDQHMERLQVAEEIESSEAKVQTRKITTSIHPAIRLGAFFFSFLFIIFGL